MKQAAILATNDKAIKLYEVGFKLEGVLRHQNFRGGSMWMKA